MRGLGSGHSDTDGKSTTRSSAVYRRSRSVVDVSSVLTVNRTHVEKTAAYFALFFSSDLQPSFVLPHSIVGSPTLLCLSDRQSLSCGFRVAEVGERAATRLAARIRKSAFCSSRPGESIEPLEALIAAVPTNPTVPPSCHPRSVQRRRV